MESSDRISIDWRVHRRCRICNVEYIHDEKNSQGWLLDFWRKRVGTITKGGNTVEDLGGERGMGRGGIILRRHLNGDNVNKSLHTNLNRESR